MLFSVFQPFAWIYEHPQQMNLSNGTFEWWQAIKCVVFIGASWLYESLTVLDFIHRSSVCLLSRLMQACQFSLFWAVEKRCFLGGFGWRSSPLELVVAQTRDGAWVESGCFRGSCGLETQHSSGQLGLSQHCQCPTTASSRRVHADCAHFTSRSADLFR